MAWDPVAIEADVGLGCVDQLLSLQTCRRVIEILDQNPEVVITTTPLIGAVNGHVLLHGRLTISGQVWADPPGGGHVSCDLQDRSAV
ncbi:hypothetical protein ACGFYZ_33095 [Streptomyces sp. NPDC048330]|uniref:hypothetical protein n=1 Tax=Streptomyces sp. NPDC048330 TaxID=3365533 RepID=UPI003717F5AE